METMTEKFPLWPDFGDFCKLILFSIECVMTDKWIYYRIFFFFCSSANKCQLYYKVTVISTVLAQNQTHRSLE